MPHKVRAEVEPTVPARAHRAHNRRKRHVLASWWLVDPALECAHIQARSGKHSWQAKVLSFIHQRNMQNALLCLLAIDVVAVICDLFLDAEFPHCRIIERDAISCCNDTAPDSHNHMLASHPGSGDTHISVGHGHHAQCSGERYGGHTYTTGLPAYCDPHKHEALHVVHDVLFASSVSILSIFLLELLVLLAILRVSFFRNYLYIFDLFVVSSALALEIALRKSDANDVAGFLILLRLWRFMRIAHGLATITLESSHDDEHASHGTQASSTSSSQASKSKELEERIAALSAENAQLKQQLAA